MKKHRAILAIDFDGTIVEHNYPAVGKLKPWAEDVINRLYCSGYYIIVWTCRGGSQLLDARDFLIASGVNFHRINENAPINETGFLPSPKIYADIYIDDRNLGGLPSWPEIYHIITGQDFFKES